MDTFFKNFVGTKASISESSSCSAGIKGRTCSKIVGKYGATELAELSKNLNILGINKA